MDENKADTKTGGLKGIKDKEFVFREYQLDTDIEQYDVTDFYQRESLKLKQGIYTTKYKGDNEEDDDEESDDSDGDENGAKNIDEAYLSKALNTKNDDRHV